MELEQENAFYDAHRAEFREKYMDKWLVIAGSALWGVYDKFSEAAQAAVGNLNPGEFMIRKPAEDGKVIHVGPGNRVCVEYPDGAKRPKPKIVSMTYTSGDGLKTVRYDH